MHVAKCYAPKAVIFANGSLHNVDRAVAALDDGADVVTLGRGALANPNLPRRLSERGLSKRVRSGHSRSDREHQRNRTGDVKAGRRRLTIQ